MKKYIIATLTLLSVVNCSDEFLNTETQDLVSTDRFEDVLKKYPEKAMFILGGLEQGNTRYLASSNTREASTGAHDDFGYMSIKLGLDHMTNDFIQTQNHWFSSYYRYLAPNVDNTGTEMIWKFYYKVIFNMNELLTNLPEESTLDQQGLYFKGRLLTMRAACYLDLIRLYAKGSEGIPYIALEKGISVASRYPTASVYGEIEKDLLRAYSLLNGYSTGASKEFINQNVAAGFLARLYLTTGNNSEAAKYAKYARTGYSPMSSTQLMDGFSDINNPEWMWGTDISTSTSTVYASFFSHIANLSPGYAGLLRVYKSIDKRLYEKISDTDIRKKWFDGTAHNLPKYANVKFVDATRFEGDYVYMRASEMYLIEAEALALFGDEAKAKQVLFELISKRDPSYSLSTNSGQALLEEIRTHKRIELWGEGVTFFDMKRLNEALVRDYAGSNHASHGKFNIEAGSDKFRFKIPQRELDTNPKVSN
ncbi:RagB/SusD family nutrient uptake outer membrane protein [Riemerella anatipestifer]|uniref:Ragb/susd domain protein n=3 Tax=Riemerella anatipestifer TaxID=34085 RepID=E4TCF2_RIEAD|nr:RagB/SusD family nutrient uptake outer membrane protein [Riemerella anatipestifer]ADQ82461.1 RagB/SusD domain protein [Riemerella anatipestifer ATCC 11845 = DSM 15868]ADZ12044.1 ragb/susd domain-containing protein [Riemerella anatipestifer RA-GD]AFD56467.1 ragb/susd domain protein [Riemerella anatipestifer ATCC 11845 = DSM 15868]AKP71567.1 ragb/susd domain-containing protein [Riemerella anatipestifer]AKQ39810.1 carbohydrate-binding protein SusD [Riemerella anatipestifer Yb2]